MKRAKGETTHYVFLGTEPIFEKKIATNKIKSYVYALGKHLARVDGVIGETTAKTYFYHTDHVGSIRAVSDQLGKVVWNADYFAFGTKSKENGEFEELHGFTGKEFDPDSGLYYFNARWYDSELGRFISEDPGRDPNNPNLYNYCRNNPHGYIDPTGLDDGGFDSDTDDGCSNGGGGYGYDGEGDDYEDSGDSGDSGYNNPGYNYSYGWPEEGDPNGDWSPTEETFENAKHTWSDEVFNEFCQSRAEEVINQWSEFETPDNPFTESFGFSDFSSNSILETVGQIIGISYSVPDPVYETTKTTTDFHGYYDLNITCGFVIDILGVPVPVGITFGVQKDAKSYHGYFGGGLVGPPGVGVSIQKSETAITQGWNVGIQASAIVSGQVGVNKDGYFDEVGLGTPGASLTGYYVW